MYYVNTVCSSEPLALVNIKHGLGAGTAGEGVRQQNVFYRLRLRSELLWECRGVASLNFEFRSSELSIAQLINDCNYSFLKEERRPCRLVSQTFTFFDRVRTKKRGERRLWPPVSHSIQL